MAVRDGIAGGPRHEPMLVSSPLIFFIFNKFALIFQHISRLLLNIVKHIKEITLTSATGRICVWGKGAWQWRLVIYPDNCTYLSVIGRISVQGEGAWRRRLQTPTHVQAHKWAANYFLVRMVVPGTKPVENPCGFMHHNCNGIYLCNVFIYEVYKIGRASCRERV